MARFLDTYGVTNALSQIIKNAQDRLILISPYLQVSDGFKEMLEDRDRFKIDIKIIYMEDKLRPQESSWLKSLKYVKIYSCKNLHAKCYLNENEALITSMNFYEFSQVHNKEMGILVSKTDDPKLYDEIYEEVKRIQRTCDYEIDSIIIKPIIKNEPIINNQTDAEGFCIRCGTRIKMDIEHPYCLTDFQKWKKFSDKTYQEKKGICHICGKPNKSSMEKPVCVNCYKQNRSLFKN
jgi:phosphatidylserine/phosphatidylglycerophosphate/cardiolipin synthase-like enzyme